MNSAYLNVVIVRSSFILRSGVPYSAGGCDAHLVGVCTGLAGERGRGGGLGPALAARLPRLHSLHLHLQHHPQVRTFGERNGG